LEEIIPKVTEEVKAEAPPSFMEKLMQKVDEPEVKAKEAIAEAPPSFMDKLIQKKFELMAEKDEIPAEPEKKQSFMDKLMQKVDVPAADEVKKPGSGVLSNVLSNAPSSSAGFVTPSVDLKAINQQNLVITTGVGVAALGVFAALVAAGDEGSTSAAERQPMRTSASKPKGSPAGATYLDALSTTSRSSTSGRQTPSSSSYLSNLSGGVPAKVKPSTIQKKVVKENAATYMGALSMGKVAPLKSSAPPPPKVKLARSPGKVDSESGEKIDETAAKVVVKPSVTSSSSSTQEAPVPNAVTASSEMQEQSPPPPPPQGPRSYLDQLSPPKAAASPPKGAKQPAPAFGRSYLDSLAPPENIMSQEPVTAAPDETPTDSNEMLPSITELDQSRILEEVSR
jgi:hypothetical protein